MLSLPALFLLLWAACLCEASSKVIGYLPNWLYANYPVEKVAYDKYTHINYAFAVENSADSLPAFTDDWAIESALPKIIELAHKAKTKVLLSVGGWTGSQMFSTMAATHEGRKKFIDWNLEFISKYNTDGVDIDWEYPAKSAAGCNKVNPGDSAHLLSLLKDLRAALDKKFPNDRKLISMAVHVEPFVGKNGPMKNVSAFVPYFDHINIMTYDINGAWASVTGPNAPFRAEPGRPEVYSYTSAIQAWKNAGVPAEKITAGLAFYGRSIKAKGDMSLQKSQYQPSEVGAPKGDSDDAWWADPYCPKDGAGVSGIWKWSNLRSEGLLKSDLVSTGNGWKRYWDNVSQTPWLFNPSSKIYISYDDPRSLEVKVQYAVCEGLGGVMVWDIHQDNGELIRAVEKIHTLKPNKCPLGNTPPRLEEASDFDMDEYELAELDPDHDNDIESSLAFEEDSSDYSSISGEDGSELDSGFYDEPAVDPSFDIIDLDPSFDDNIDLDTSFEDIVDINPNFEDIVDLDPNFADNMFFDPISAVPIHSNSESDSIDVDDTFTNIPYSDPFDDFFSDDLDPVVDDDDDDYVDDDPPQSIVDSGPSPSVSSWPLFPGDDIIGFPPKDDSDIVLDGSCPTDGVNTCVDSGISGDWGTCNFNKWIIRQCAPGLVCHDHTGSIYCGTSDSTAAMVAMDFVNGIPRFAMDAESEANIHHFVVASADTPVTKRL